MKLAEVTEEVLKKKKKCFEMLVLEHGTTAGIKNK